MDNSEQVNQTFIERDIESPGKKDTKHKTKQGSEYFIHEQGARYDKLLCAVLIYLNIIASILICILASVIWIENHRAASAPGSGFCLPTNMVTGHPYDRTDIPGCNSEQCCFQNINSTGPAIKHIASHWLKVKMANDPNRKFDRFECDGKKDEVTSVLLPLNTLKLHSRRRRSAEKSENVLWNGTEVNMTNDSFYVLHGDVGIIEITKSALYYVYSQVNIQYKMRNVTDSSKFYHIVASRPNLNDKKDEKYLFRHSNSMCEYNNDDHIFTSYLAGNVYLSVGDKIVVRVYDGILFEMRPEANFLGLHKLKSALF